MADEQKGTIYKVLVPVVDEAPREGADPHGGLWQEVDGVFMASNDLAAIKAASEAHGPFEHGAVAVPARSWRPRKREVKSVQRELWT